MDFQGLVNLALGMGFTVFGWFAKTLWDAQQELRRDMNLLHVKITEEYVPDHRFQSVLKSISEDIRYIRDKLDEKAEKP